SSGMAAYSLIEAFLLRNRLTPGDTVLLAPYIYFEVAEQLASIRGLRVIHGNSFASASLAAEAAHQGAAVVCADALANNLDQRMVDVRDLLFRIESSSKRPTLVVDGSMLPADFSSALSDFSRPEQILYYESCSKYLQYGQDT